MGDLHSLLGPEQPQRSSLRPSQSDFLLPVRASLPWAMALVLWIWTACSRGLLDPQRKTRCVFCRRKHGGSGPVSVTGRGHAQSFLLPPSPILQAFLGHENHNVVSQTGADAF